MKVNITKVASVLMVVALLAATGCSKPNSDGTSSPAASSKPSVSESSKEALTPMTIRFAAGDNNPLWDDMQSEVGKLITQKTGISIKAQFPVGGNDDMFSLMVASNDYPDMVAAKGSASKLKDAGALIDLAPLIDQYAPNLKKLYGEYMKRLRWSNDDHGIYVLPTAWGKQPVLQGRRRLRAAACRGEGAWLPANQDGEGFRERSQSLQRQAPDHS